MVKIIEDNIAFKKQLEEQITIQGTYIDLNYLDAPYNKRTDRLGLNYALEELDRTPDRIIVLYSFENPQDLYLDNKFMQVMAKPNVHFVRLPFTGKILTKEILTPKFYNQALDIESRIEYKSDLRGRLLHNYRPGDEEVLRKIKEEFKLEGTENEIIDQLRKYNSQTVEPKGFLPGVFVDVQGTLIQKGKIDEKVISLIKNYAKTKPVSIWTGGDKKEIAKHINGHLYKAFEDLHDIVTPTRIPILSKNTFVGFEPEIIIDDMNTADFKATYNMTPREHIKIK